MRGMLLGLLAGAALTAAPASAAVVTYNWVAGDYTGSVSYNTDAVTSDFFNEGPGDAGYKRYSGADFKATVTYQGTTTTFLQQMFVANNYYGSIDDLEFYNGSSPFGYFNVQLQDQTGAAMNSRNIPSVIDPTPFPIRRVMISGNTIAMSSFVQAAVPEPASWAMMVTGFLGLGTMLRRRRNAGAALIG